MLVSIFGVFLICILFPAFFLLPECVSAASFALSTEKVLLSDKSESQYFPCALAFCHIGDVLLNTDNPL